MRNGIGDAFISSHKLLELVVCVALEGPKILEENFHKGSEYHYCVVSCRRVLRCCFRVSIVIFLSVCPGMPGERDFPLHRLLKSLQHLLEDFLLFSPYVFVGPGADDDGI